MNKSYVKVPTVYQMEATECGAASLSMILAHWGRHMPLEQLRIETGVSRDGCNAGNILRAAKRLGLECHGYRKQASALKKLSFPCIIHWGCDHFVVLEGFRGKYAFLNDPACGRRRITMDELEKGYTGVVLTFAPTDAFETQKSTNSTMAFIHGLIGSETRTLLCMALSGLLILVPGIGVPVATQIFIDKVLRTDDTIKFAYILIFLCGAVLLKVALSLYRSAVVAKMRDRLVLLSSKQLLCRMLRLPVNFYEQRYTGELCSRADSNENVNVFIAQAAAAVPELVSALFFLAALLIYAPLLALIGIVGIAAVLIIMKLSADTAEEKAVRLRQDTGKLFGAVCAGLGITSTIKASGAEDVYCERIIESSSKVSQQERGAGRIRILSDVSVSGIFNITTVVILAAGALTVVNNGMTVGTLFAFVLLYGSFYDITGRLAVLGRKLHTFRADMARVNDIMSYPAEAKSSAADTAARAKLSGAVECRGLSFGYSRLAEPLITELSFSVPPGGSLAFVGRSGSGKSTVTKLISGLYRPWEGVITIDGIPLDEIPSEALHASVAVVNQDITVFSGSIRDNITMWNPAVSEQDMINAAKDACIHDTIMRRSGAYEHMLSEGGANLSGGQRQRLEIARALATNPTILIMDEATSALDPIVEKQITDNIKRRGCTCIIVAHRLSAVRDCDNIIVLSDGRILQQGTHEQLVDCDGAYKSIMAAE